MVIYRSSYGVMTPVFWLLYSISRITTPTFRLFANFNNKNAVVCLSVPKTHWCFTKNSAIQKLFNEFYQEVLPLILLSSTPFTLNFFTTALDFYHNHNSSLYFYLKPELPLHFSAYSVEMTLKATVWNKFRKNVLVKHGYRTGKHPKLILILLK